MEPKAGMKRQRSPWFCIEMSAVDYRQAWDLQARLVRERKAENIDRDLVLLLEHFPVFTLGRRGGLENLKVSQEFLKDAGIPVIHTERGGDITFHAPGQLVVYPIVDLRSAGIGVADYVEKLEEIMIRTARDWGIQAARNPLNRGVWVDHKKMGSIGIAIRRGVCFHGMALNVNLSLEPFCWINPCGLDKTRATSMGQELSGEVSMKEVREAVKGHIQEVFGVELVMTDFGELRKEGTHNENIKRLKAPRLNSCRIQRGRQS